MEVDSHFPPLTLKKEGFSEWTHKSILKSQLTSTSYVDRWFSNSQIRDK